MSEIEEKPFYELYKKLLMLKEYRNNPEAAYATADFVWQLGYRIDTDTTARKLLIEQTRKELLDEIKQFRFGMIFNGEFRIKKDCALEGVLFVIPFDQYKIMFER